MSLSTNCGFNGAPNCQSAQGFSIVEWAIITKSIGTAPFPDTLTLKAEGFGCQKWVQTRVFWVSADADNWVEISEKLKTKFFRRKSTTPGAKNPISHSVWQWQTKTEPLGNRKLIHPERGKGVQGVALRGKGHESRSGEGFPIAGGAVRRQPQAG